MYSNVAYIKNADTDSLSLSINCCGYEHSLEANSATQRPHGRSDYLLLYTAAGNVHIVTGNTEQIFPAGTVVLYKPNQPQRYKYMKDDQSESFWVHFSGKNVEGILSEFGMTSPSIFFTRNLSDLNQLFLQLISECQSSKPYFLQSASLILQNIFLHIARNSVCQNDMLPEETHKTPQNVLHEVTNAINYFNEHYAEKINIAEYAEKLHMSTCWFIRVFKKYANSTPTQYITAIRLSKAKSLLESTTLSIDEIAEKVGYSDYKYFSRIFKQHTGVSPFAYRKKNW